MVGMKEEYTLHQHTNTFIILTIMLLILVHPRKRKGPLPGKFSQIYSILIFHTSEMFISKKQKLVWGKFYS